MGAHACLALGGPIIWLGIGLWGVHLAMTQGVLSALISASAPAALRGTAFGVFYLVSGLALLVASTLAGTLWDRSGPAAPFIAGAVFCVVALALLSVLERRQHN